MKLFRDSASRLHATSWRYVVLLSALAMTIPTSSPIHAQGTLAVSVVNMIPHSLSGELLTDSEPNLAVNPSNTQQIAASAFTPDPMAGPNAPIYLSTDGGQTWVLNSIVPGGNPKHGTNDITLGFGSASNVLYAATLRGDESATGVSGGKLNILRTNNFTSPNAMTVLVDRGGVDQPYIEVISVAGKDRVYVGNNDLNAAGGMTATVDRSLDAAPPAPAGFSSQRIEARSTCRNDSPSVRPAVHEVGTIYAAFFRWTSCPSFPFPGVIITDVVVVRDDNFAAGPSAFTALREPPAPAGDGMPGVRVATGVSVFFGGPLLGNQRVGSRIAIAVDPNNSQRVYLAWGDGADAASYAIRVRKSVDGGATWSGYLRRVPSATNPSLAINSRGRVGFLYQRLTGTSANQRWETHLERTDDDFATPPMDLILNQAPDNVGDESGAGPLGDYIRLMAVGRDFYGVFSANNTPDMANFPQGVKYQRNVNFGTGKLLAVDNVTEVRPSIDPFFFKVPEVLIVDSCVRRPWLCLGPPKLERGFVTLECALRGCIIVDPLPQNCRVKFNCPGCGPGGLCPPYYNIHLDGLQAAWDVALYDARGTPVEHKQFNTRTGLVISFRPSKENYLEGRIGNYFLGFEMGPKGKPGKKYKVKARLERSDSAFELPK